jgi:hypothetical protein
MQLEVILILFGFLEVGHNRTSDSQMLKFLAKCPLKVIFCDAFVVKNKV